jgi:hypothetical protein
MKFYFHLDHRSEQVTDREGTDLVDLEAAKEEARAAIRDLAAVSLNAGRKFTLWSIRICSDSGEMLHEVPVSEVLVQVIPAEIIEQLPLIGRQS